MFIIQVTHVITEYYFFGILIFEMFSINFLYKLKKYIYNFLPNSSD